VESCNLLGSLVRIACGSLNGQSTPLSYFNRGMRAKAEVTDGTPMTRPEKVSPPPNFSEYKLDDGTMVKKDI
jgi:hypothetical protein